jgi:hypothetical protein
LKTPFQLVEIGERWRCRDDRKDENRESENGLHAHLIGNYRASDFWEFSAPRAAPDRQNLPSRPDLCGKNLPSGGPQSHRDSEKPRILLAC